MDPMSDIDAEYSVDLVVSKENDYGGKLTKIRLERIIRTALEANSFVVDQVFVQSYKEDYH
jgi:hypothetical protein